jgi:hypothetical protein
MDKYLTRVLQLASDNPEYQALSNYLMSRRAFPEIQYRPDFSGTYGSFSQPGLFNSPVPNTGLVKLNANPESTGAQYMTPTLTHELTHAAQRQLDYQYRELQNKKNKSDLEKQFVDNYEKIIGYRTPEISNQIKQLAPQFLQDKGDYRASTGEALAFGLENSAYPKNDFSSKAPSHVDPTLATQLMLLLEQAQRVQDQQPASQGR